MLKYLCISYISYVYQYLCIYMSYMCCMQITPYHGFQLNHTPIPPSNIFKQYDVQCMPHYTAPCLILRVGFKNNNTFNIFVQSAWQKAPCFIWNRVFSSDGWQARAVTSPSPSGGFTPLRALTKVECNWVNPADAGKKCNMMQTSPLLFHLHSWHGLTQFFQW